MSENTEVADLIKKRSNYTGILTAVVRSMKLSSGGDSYEIETIENHPDYDPKTIKHDISLLKVKGTIKFGDNVQTIELPSSDIGVGEVCTVTGWGRLGWASSEIQKAGGYHLLGCSVRCGRSSRFHESIYVDWIKKNIGK
ncbi:unnamed protein product [Pieris macdunnoughi]|uniref:Peptidase S1 domain-containing protein n=1 Tax=Pieris macdunnoughi TaxID=345717 RepID=A0A821REF1_9NEOP|nr:unnamed protein product [Pieris macdunnoughi]